MCVNTTQSADAVARISQESGVEVIYKADEKMYEMMGSREEIQAAIQAIRMLSICQVCDHVVAYYIQKYHNNSTFMCDLL